MDFSISSQLFSHNVVTELDCHQIIMLLLCVSSKYLYSPPHHPCPHGRSFGILKGRGSLNFQRGWAEGGGGGVKPKKFNSVRDAWIFSGTSYYYHSQSIRGGQ